MTLTYKCCDDWFIFATDEQGREFYVSTELWPEWLDCPEDEDGGYGATEKYMLPIAMRSWTELDWQLVPEIETESDIVVEVKTKGIARWKLFVLEHLVRFFNRYLKSVQVVFVTFQEDNRVGYVIVEDVNCRIQRLKLEAWDNSIEIRYHKKDDRLQLGEDDAST